MTSGLNIWAITVGVKRYRLAINKEKKKHDKIVLLAKSKLNLIDSNISHDEFVLINNVPKEFDDMKEEIKNCNDK